LSSEQTSMRLQRYLAMCGIASRRKAEEFILEGRVKLNGDVVRVLGTKVVPGDVVKFDDRTVSPERVKLYIALNKPRGYICSSSDPDGRPKAIDLLSDAFNERIFSIGRLDFNTSGLLLFTNDGDFAKVVSHPSSQIEKEYLVETSEPIQDASLKDFKKGVMIDRVRYRILRYEQIGKQKVRIVLIEGKNREIRKLFESAGFYVKKIHRVRIGPVQLGNLRPGAYRLLSEREKAVLYAGKRDQA